jgi:hypothetical protein
MNFNELIALRNSGLEKEIEKDRDFYISTLENAYLDFCSKSDKMKYIFEYVVILNIAESFSEETIKRLKKILITNNETDKSFHKYMEEKYNVPHMKVCFVGYKNQIKIFLKKQTEEYQDQLGDYPTLMTEIYKLYEEQTKILISNLKHSYECFCEDARENPSIIGDGIYIDFSRDKSIEGNICISINKKQYATLPKESKITLVNINYSIPSIEQALLDYSFPQESIRSWRGADNNFDIYIKLVD